MMADGGHGKPEIIEKHRRDPFVHQNPAVLRIVQELDHVEVAVGGFKEVRLRSAAHLADQPAGINRHFVGDLNGVT